MKTLYTLRSLLLFAGLILLTPEAHARKLDSIRVFVPSDELILPGEKFRIGVRSYSHGKARNTFGLLSGITLWSNYKVEVENGTFSNGSVTVSPDLLPAVGKEVRINISPKKQPKLARTVLVPLNYETAIRFVPLKNFIKAPGEEIKGEVQLHYNNGIVTSVGDFMNKRKTPFLTFFVANGGLERNRFLIPDDFRDIPGHRSSLRITSALNPDVEGYFEVQLDYKKPYNLAFYGAGGYSGHDGHDGGDGITGWDGESGGHGQDGSEGGRGPDLDVWADAYFDSVLQTQMLYVIVKNYRENVERFYLVNPMGGSIKIVSTGGRGGSGGAGGDGGNGGTGVDGKTWIERIIEKKVVQKPETVVVKKLVKKTRKNAEGKDEEYEEEVEETITRMVDVEVEEVREVLHQEPGGPGGRGGYGGYGGNGGPGGDGGYVTLYLTDDARPFRYLIEVKSRGGSGGSGGFSGSGGRGGSGGNGTPTGPSGSSGSSGNSGHMGSSGYDGMVTVDRCDKLVNY